MPLPFHDKAQLAAEAALAAGEQGKFWEYHDKLFANQQALDAASLEKYAGEVGLNVDKWKAAKDSQKLKALAFLGFFLNLFNLLPVIPLDGGRVTAALHPALWFVGFLALLALVIYRPNPILIIILLLAASELWRRWQMRGHPQMQEYYRVTPRRRLIIGVLYFGLAVALVFGMHATHVPHQF